MILGGIHEKGSTDLDTYFISFSFQLADSEQLFNFIFKFSFTSGPILYFISFSFHLRTPSEITTLHIFTFLQPATASSRTSIQNAYKRPLVHHAPSHAPTALPRVPQAPRGTTSRSDLASAGPQRNPKITDAHEQPCHFTKQPPPCPLPVDTRQLRSSTAASLEGALGGLGNLGGGWTLGPLRNLLTVLPAVRAEDEHDEDE